MAFAEIKFTCDRCKQNITLDVTETPTVNKYNWNCECGASYLVNRTTGVVVRWVRP